MTRIAIFTDTDLTWDSSLGTALGAVLQHSPPDLHARVLTMGDLPADTDRYFAAPSLGLPFPWDRGQRGFWPRVRPFARQIRADQPEVIHLATTGPVGLAGRWLARRLGLPAVASVHTLAATAQALGRGSRLAALSERLSRWAYDGCESVLAPSRAAADRLAASGVARVRPSGSGVDTARFTPDRASSALRQRWHVDQRRPAILIPAQSLTQADAVLIEQVRQGLHRHALAHQLIFVGRDGARRELRQTYPEGVFIEDLADPLLPAAMASADLCLFTSASDIVGSILLEAQASGLPVIVPDAGGAMEQIVAEETGCVVRAGAADDIVSRVADLIRHPDRRREMSRAARAHATTHGWPAMLAPLHDAWRTAAARPRVRTGAARPAAHEAA